MTDHDKDILRNLHRGLVRDLTETLQDADAATAILTLEIVISALDEALNAAEERAQA